MPVSGALAALSGALAGYLVVVRLPVSVALAR